MTWTTSCSSIDQQVAAYERQGLSHDEAMRQARIEFGTFDQAKEEHRDARGIRLIDDLRRDTLRRAAIRRAPAFVVAALLSWRSVLARRRPSTAS